MKNVKVDLKKASKAGFSLVEMLVVIAIIGIIAAIAIPNIGSINSAARDATAKRNAQSVASVLNSAVAAGAVLPLTAASTAQEIVEAAEAGVTPIDGPFATKLFTTGDIDADEVTYLGTKNWLSYDEDNQQVRYTPGDL